MPRAARARVCPVRANACYHVMNRGHNREAVFADDDDRLCFLSLLARYRDRYRFRLYYYCLMTNHFHLLLHLDRPRLLSKALAGLLRSYVHHCHRRYGFVGHLWQGRFKSPLIQAERYLLSCGRYIERNPLEVGLVAQPWDYRWSSCRAYALGEADALLAENAWYLAFAADGGLRQARWQEFLLGADGKEEVIRRGEWATGEVTFRPQMHQGQPRAEPRGRGRPLKVRG